MNHLAASSGLTKASLIPSRRETLARAGYLFLAAILLLACSIPRSQAADAPTLMIQADPYLEVAREMVGVALDAAGFAHEFALVLFGNEKRQLLMLEGGQMDIDITPQTGLEITARNGRFLEILEKGGRGLPEVFLSKRRIIELENSLYGYDIVGQPFRHLLRSESVFGP